MMLSRGPIRDYNYNILKYYIYRLGVDRSSCFPFRVRTHKVADASAGNAVVSYIINA